MISGSFSRYFLSPALWLRSIVRRCVTRSNVGGAPSSAEVKVVRGVGIVDSIEPSKSGKAIKVAFSVSNSDYLPSGSIPLAQEKVVDFVKQAHEVTSGHRKEGKRRGGRTPMRLLADAVETYRAEDVARWWQWESAAEGRRSAGACHQAAVHR